MSAPQTSRPPRRIHMSLSRRDPDLDNQIPAADDAEPATFVELRSDPDFIKSVQEIDPRVREFYYGRDSKPEQNGDGTSAAVELIYDFTRPEAPPMRFEASNLSDLATPPTFNARQLPFGTLNSGNISLGREVSGLGSSRVFEMQRMIQRAIKTYGNQLPVSIWTCCKRCCFSLLAADPQSFVLFDEILRIQEVVVSFQKKIGDVNDLAPSRRKGRGRSHIAFDGRVDREGHEGYRTDRQMALSRLASFITDILPFFYGLKDSSCGVRRPNRKLCTEAICSVLGISRNFIYRRKKMTQEKAEQEVIYSILDNAGARMRQHRRIGKRTGYTEMDQLQNFDCGCSEPCLAEFDPLRLRQWYNDFKLLARHIKPRRRENRYLLNIMYCPLLNATVQVCNKALSELFTVSESVIVDVRTVLQKIINDPSQDSRPLLEEKEKGYQYNPRHPINRYPDSIRDKVESLLDITLRADPGASGGVNVCRVYSPEINTQQKLRNVLAEQLEADEVVNQPISSSSLQRMINAYLAARDCEISFTQSDHNACPNCKTFGYALLQFSHEVKVLKAEKAVLDSFPRPFEKLRQEGYERVELELRAKEFQDRNTLEDLKQHTSRDARIRKFLKKLTDYFQIVENRYRRMGDAPSGWMQRKDHAIITHQDDMTKVDLPNFIVTASSDITRWRYDVNAHVNPITNDANVFSHEQGGGAKTGSSIMEQILLDHILRCRGEGIKIVVSDNASVGKNWLTTIALPQYMVDQGLASIVMVVYLENNHGKWIADMLFGQLQTRRKRCTITGIDALLSEFESIRRKRGSVQGFAVNPLSSVDFATVLDSLGYQTKPPSDFAFIKRNIHFAVACSPGAIHQIPSKLQEMIGEMLPRSAGMVRVSTEPPTSRPQSALNFESRYIDVPAAASCFARGNRARTASAPEGLMEAPLIVPLNKAYSPSGPGVVSNRNMTHVGYNGFEFRKCNAYPELHGTESCVVREAWPRSLVDPFNALRDGEPVEGSENVKCCPENWILRRPSSFYSRQKGMVVSRYPPRNMLNAKYKRGPRVSSPWRATATYAEPPVPLILNSSAFQALSEFSERHKGLEENLNVLDILHCIYNRIGGREWIRDPWLQHRATVAESVSVSKYNDDVALFNERNRGHPSATRTIKQLFREDQSVKDQVARTRRDCSNGTPESENSIVNRLFNEATDTPGSLDRFEHLAAKDLDRYVAELKHFKEVTQKKFDEDHDFPQFNSMNSNHEIDS